LPHLFPPLTDRPSFQPVLYAASGWVSWVILFEGIYKLYNSTDEDQSRAAYTPRVEQVIELLFFLALVISIQRIVFHFIGEPKKKSLHNKKRILMTSSYNQRSRSTTSRSKSARTP
jgi:hypothetical protein